LSETKGRKKAKIHIEEGNSASPSAPLCCLRSALIVFAGNLKNLGGFAVRYACFLFRSFFVFMLSMSLLLSPAIPALAGNGSDAVKNTLPGLSGLPPNIMKILMPPLPPGIPVPVPVPVPVPGVVVEKEKHRDRDYGSQRYDNRDYRHHQSDWRHDRHRDWRYRPYGSIHRSLPAEAFALSIAGAAFFYHMGVYYRHTHDGYVVVQAPLGARVRILPESCSTLYIDGRRYYDCNDVYYEPDGDEYIVIQRPSSHQYPEVEIGDEVRIKAEYLNVRSGPGERNRVIDKLYRGDIVEVGGIDREWYYVRLPNGQYGWIMRSYARFHRSKNEVKG
jgi:hypothetical protein